MKTLCDLLSKAQSNPSEAASMLAEGNATSRSVMKGLVDFQHALRPVGTDQTFSRFIDKFLALPDPGSRLLKLHKLLEFSDYSTADEMDHIRSNNGSETSSTHAYVSCCIARRNCSWRSFQIFNFILFYFIRIVDTAIRVLSRLIQALYNLSTVPGAGHHTLVEGSVVLVACVVRSTHRWAGGAAHSFLSRIIHCMDVSSILSCCFCSHDGLMRIRRRWCTGCIRRHSGRRRLSRLSRHTLLYTTTS
jgi:hypothetical protein